MSPTTSSRPPHELAEPTRHIFLSPHYDDVPLSAGGTVRLLAESGRTPETLVVFGSEPDHARPLSSFARELHDVWGFSASEVIASRQTEETAAAEILGAMSGVLPFRDAIYREDHYTSDDDLFGDPVPAESDLPAQIGAALQLSGQTQDDVRIYAPLAVGRHVDHQIVFRAAALLSADGWDVWFFEDIPYGLKPGAFDARLQEIRAATSIEPMVSIPVQSTWDARIDSILSYPSQLETIFLNYVGVGASGPEISEALQEYARAAGEGELVERFWKIKDASSN